MARMTLKERKRLELTARQKKDQKRRRSEVPPDPEHLRVIEVMRSAWRRQGMPGGFPRWLAEQALDPDDTILTESGATIGEALGDSYDIPRPGELEEDIRLSDEAGEMLLTAGEALGLDVSAQRAEFEAGKAARAAAAADSSVVTSGDD